MAYSDLIYYKDDLVKAYAEKRKALEEPDVNDLLKCLIGFMENIIIDEDITAIKIPSIGYLYKTVGDKMDNLSINDTNYTLDNLIVEASYYDRPSKPITMRKSILDTNYPNIKKEDLQRLQNDR